LRSFTFDAAAIAAFVGALGGPVVLVGHSYGGAVITQASAGLDNVTAQDRYDMFVPAAEVLHEHNPPGRVALKHATTSDSSTAKESPCLRSVFWSH
jgi:alpha-beta hydrolase superfamily lysophospholipase